MHIMRFIAKENNSFVGLNVAIAFSYEKELDCHMMHSILYIMLISNVFFILETLEYMKPVIDLANEVLWHWKTFPIILPPPIETKIEPAAGKFASFLIINIHFRNFIIDQSHKIKPINIQILI